MPGRGRPRNTRQGGDPTELIANRDPRHIKEIERLQQHIRELKLQQNKRNKETGSNSVVWDDGFDGEENPFGRRPPPQARSHNRGDILRSLGVRGVRVEIPEFTGTAQSDEFIDWISRGRPRNTRQGGDPTELIANRDPRDIKEIERLQQHIRELKLQQNKRNKETESNSVVWDDGFDGEENPFGRRPRPQARSHNRGDILRSQDAFFEYHSLMQNNSSVEQFIADFDSPMLGYDIEWDPEQEHLPDLVWTQYQLVFEKGYNEPCEHAQAAKERTSFETKTNM
nr:hypothetical protein [Tanacetum cinerariifolium]